MGDVLAQDGDLVDDSRPWFPEAHSILGSSTGQEVVDFSVDILKGKSIMKLQVGKSLRPAKKYRDEIRKKCPYFSSGQIFDASGLSLDQVIAVDG